MKVILRQFWDALKVSVREIFGESRERSAGQTMTEVVGLSAPDNFAIATPTHAAQREINASLKQTRAENLA